MKNQSLLLKLVVILVIVIVGAGGLYWFNSTRNTTTLYLGPTKSLCGSDQSGKAKRCYQVKTNQDQPYQAKPITIKGLHYEPGYNYVLKVKPEGSADLNSASVYELKKEIKKTPAPYLIITQPKDNQTVNKQELLAISGEARGLFEGNIVIQLVDQAGNVLVQDTSTITTNNPQDKGVWSAQLDLTDVDQAGPVLLTAFSPNSSNEAAQTELKYSVMINLEQTNQPQALDGTQWQLVSYQVAAGTKTKTVPKQIQVTANFKQGKVSGKAGCNRYSGPYQASNSEISFGPLATTKMACKGEAGTIEQAYLQLINQANQYQTQNNQLIIQDQNGAKLLVFDQAK